MSKVWLYSALLTLGMIGSQLMSMLAPDFARSARVGLTLLTMTCLAFIMIHVGLEFELDRRNLRRYAVDYGIAATAAAFPWALCAAYFVLVMGPRAGWTNFDAWKEALLAGRFAAPTSAGILFAMLAAAGLSATWTYQKARVLAIFDDLDTVLLMIPLKMLIVGLAFQLVIVVVVMGLLVFAAWRWLHTLRLPIGWAWLLGYSAVIAALCEGIHWGSTLIDDVAPVHFEVLLPAFVLGCVLAVPDERRTRDLRRDRAVASVISSLFMVLVGLSMPALGGGGMSLAALAAHVALVTVLANLGKMFPLFCYRREARLRERLALCLSMLPRGEVGAGVILVSVAYGVGGPIIAVATLSLALNLLLTGSFILAVKRLVGDASKCATRGP